MKGFYLKLESTAAVITAQDAVAELAAISKRLGLSILSNVNGVDVMAHPDTNADELVANFNVALREKHRFTSA